MTNDKFPELSEIYSQDFVFKLVFRVSGRSVPWDKPLTSKGTIDLKFPPKEFLPTIFQFSSVDSKF